MRGPAKIDGLTEHQRRALRWLASRGHDGIFSIHGVLIAMGEQAPHVRGTWNALIRAGMAEHYNPAKRGFGRLRLTTRGKMHPAASDTSLDIEEVEMA